MSEHGTKVSLGMLGLTKAMVLGRECGSQDGEKPPELGFGHLFGEYDYLPSTVSCPRQEEDIPGQLRACM